MPVQHHCTWTSSRHHRFANVTLVTKANQISTTVLVIIIAVLSSPVKQL